MSDHGEGSEYLITEPRPVDPELAQAAERRRRADLFGAFIVPSLAGLLGGAFVGMAESLKVLSAAFGTHDYSGMVYAVILYGAAGLSMGLVLGVIARTHAMFTGHIPEPARSWTISFLVVSCSMGFVITRFILRRDLFDESALSSEAVAILIACFVAYAFVFYFITRNALKKTFFSFILTVRGSGALYGGVLLFSLMMAFGNMLDNRAQADVAPRPVAPALERRPNVLLVVVDTLRRDALGAYGAGPNASPALDDFAESAVVYEEAVAQASWTRPSFASLLTSMVPCTHQTFRKADVLPDSVVTIAEVLQRHGYTTGNLANNINVTASFNFDQGFDTFRFLRPAYPFRGTESSFPLSLYSALRLFWERYVVSDKRVERYYREGNEVTDEGISWLRVHGRERWFLMLHYMDPHDPYFPHPGDDTGFARIENPRPRLADAKKMRELYAGEVQYWDQAFGRLIDYMKEHDLLENTAIVVTSDHGEEFGEHGGFWHGTRLYDEQIRVPLVIRYPRADTDDGRRIRDQVRLLDVAPTLADLAGAPHGKGWQGFSLRREYALRQPKDRLALAQADFEGEVSSSIRSPDWKYIRNDRTTRVGALPPGEEMYFLRTDGGELKNLASDSSAGWAIDKWRGDLAIIEAAGCSEELERRTRASETFSKEDCAALRALGYVDATDGRCAPR